MHNIALVCTRHESLGKCNLNELYQIIERINPEVIFEEMSPTFFDDYYLNNSRSNLETDTINKYIQNYNLIHIPVDSDDIPSKEFFKDYNNLIERVEGLADINGFNFRNLVDNNKLYIENYGFNYLNSIESININYKIYNAINHGLQKINNDKLFETFNIWKDTHEKREHHMLQIIYNYCENHSFERAIFTIGAAHRGSIINKISEFQENEKVRLNWVFELPKKHK